MNHEKEFSYWNDVFGRFWQQTSARIGTCIFLLFVFLAIYAPFFASSKPLFVIYDHEAYFPLFRYLLSAVFFTKKIDLFFNLLALFLPLMLLGFLLKKKIRVLFLATTSILCMALFILFGYFITLNPTSSANKKEVSMAPSTSRFSSELACQNSYARLQMVLDDLLTKEHHERLLKEGIENPYTLYKTRLLQKEETKKRLQEKISSTQNEEAEKNLAYIEEKELWLNKEVKKITFLVMPPLSHFHWQDDVGGDQATNRLSSFWTLVRLNRKDLVSALLFGARISLFVGLVTSLITLAVGIPLGLFAGYFGGRLDLFLSRFIEVWESLPAFFMLLLIVTIMETKSIFLVIFIIALFSWTSVFRFVRAETLKQREMLYVEACKTAGFGNLYILFYHLLPNCLVAVLALLPFDMMSAITREAGLAFLGLGEEDSPSWGQLMDEGRQAFPAESMLLWPPACALTLLLIAIACIGEAAHTACNPKTSKQGNPHA